MKENNKTKKPKIFDVFLFLNELDLLELRFKTLYKIVDYFIITEVDETFSGIKKPLIFRKYIERFKKFEKKIIYNPISKKDLEQLKNKKWVNYVSKLDRSLPYKHSGRKPFLLNKSLKREIEHRDSAILGFHKLAKPNDFILLSDLDEIPNPQTIKIALKNKVNQPHYFKMEWFLYWINNRVSKPWFGTVLFKFKHLKGNSLDNFRYASSDINNVPGPILNNGGWHFSYLGGKNEILNKLKSHPFQGYKIKLAILLDKFNIRNFEKKLKNNRDLFFQDRELKLIDIKKNFPKSILNETEFIKKYLHE